MSGKADERIEARIRDNTPSDKGLITFKFPVQLPYHTDETEFEKAEGEINVNGVIYKLVKKKVYRDTLIVLCINHAEKTLIQKEINDYFNKVNELASNTSKKGVSKQITVDYYLLAKLLSIGTIPQLLIEKFNSPAPEGLSAGYCQIIASPPDLFLS